MLNSVVSKGEFAVAVNLSKGRISQLIAEGKLDGAMVGEGRNARIDLDKGREALKLRLDPAQRLGNGAATNLASPASAATAKETDTLDLQLKQAKVAQLEAANAKQAEEALARRGIYVRAEHATAEAGKLAGLILQMFEGGLNDAAAEIAAHFKLPARDVTHLMRQRFRAVRANVSARLAQDAASLPPLVEDEPT